MQNIYSAYLGDLRQRGILVHPAGVRALPLFGAAPKSNGKEVTKERIGLGTSGYYGARSLRSRNPRDARCRATVEDEVAHKLRSHQVKRHLMN